MSTGMSAAAQDPSKIGKHVCDTIIHAGLYTYDLLHCDVEDMLDQALYPCDLEALVAGLHHLCMTAQLDNESFRVPHVRADT